MPKDKVADKTRIMAPNYNSIHPSITIMLLLFTCGFIEEIIKPTMPAHCEAENLDNARLTPDLPPISIAVAKGSGDEAISCPYLINASDFILVFELISFFIEIK